MKRETFVLFVFFVVVWRSSDCFGLMSPKEQKLMQYFLEETAINIFFGDLLGVEVKPSKNELRQLNHCLNDWPQEDSYVGMMDWGVETLMVLKGPVWIKGLEYGETIIEIVRTNEAIRTAVLLLDEFCRKRGWVEEIGVGEEEKKIMGAVRDALSVPSMEGLEKGLRTALAKKMDGVLLDSVVTWVFLSSMENRSRCKEAMLYALERESYRKSALRWLSFISKEGNREVVDLVLEWGMGNIDTCRKKGLEGAVLGLISTRADKNEKVEVLIEKITKDAVCYSTLAELYPTEEERKRIKKIIIEKNPDISKEDFAILENKLDHADQSVVFGYNNRHLFELGFTTKEYITLRHLASEQRKLYLFNWIEGDSIKREEMAVLDPRPILERQARNNAKIKLAHRFFLEEVKKKTETGGK